MSPGQGQDPQGVGTYSLHQGWAEPRVLLDGPWAHEVAPGTEAPPALMVGSVPHHRSPAPFRISFRIGPASQTYLRLSVQLWTGLDPDP